MKEKITKGSVDLVVFLVVTVGIPGFFRFYPDFRFFWNCCVVLAIGFQTFFMIVGKREGRYRHLIAVFMLLLSVIMSNEYYRFETLTTVLPFLKQFTEDGLFGLGLLIIGFFAVGGMVCHVYIHYMQKIKEKTSGFSRQDITDSIAATMEQSTNAMRPCHMIGVTIAISFIVISTAVILYALCKNPDFLLRLSNQKIPYLAFNLLMGIGIVFAAIFVITILTFYFIQMCYTIIRDMFQQHKLDIQNESLLKCLSVFITMFCFFFCRNATLKDLFGMVNESNGTESMRKVVITFMALVFLTWIIYKLLWSFAYPDGTLRNYANKIFSLIITAVGDTIINILEVVSNIPDLINLSIDAAKRALDDLWIMLWNMDEDDFEDLYHR